jgi:hypothetical protein
MAVITDAAAGAGLAAFGGGPAVANRGIWTPDGTTLVTDEDWRFDGTDMSLGGALSAGTRLFIHQAFGGNGLQTQANQASEAGNVTARSSDARLTTINQRGSAAGGTLAGIAAASLSQLQMFNASAMLVGCALDAAPLYLSLGANNAGGAIGAVKTVQADAGNVGGGLDVLATFTPGNALFFADGFWLMAWAAVRYAANANTKRACLKFGTTVIAETAAGLVAKNGGSSLLTGHVRRVNGTTQRAWGTHQGTTFAAADPLISTPGETLSGAPTFTVEAESGASASNDVVLDSLLVICGHGKA